MIAIEKVNNGVLVSAYDKGSEPAYQLVFRARDELCNHLLKEYRNDDKQWVQLYFDAENADKYAGCLLDELLIFVVLLEDDAVGYLTETTLYNAFHSICNNLAN